MWELFTIRDGLQRLVALLVLLVASQPGYGTEGMPVELTKWTGIPCYDFQNNGDVYVHCQDKRTKITEGGTVVNFAVARDGSALVLNQHKFEVQHDGSFKETPDKVEIIGLQNGFVTRTVPGMELYRLVPSCGTVLVFGLPGGPPVQDLLQRGASCFEPYRHFRCSGDRAVVVGETLKNRGALSIGIPPQRGIGGGKPLSGPSLYDVSPSGRYVAFGDDDLCVTERNGVPQCIRSVNSNDRISVSDSGEVIFDMGTGKPCFYRDMWHGSPEPLAGYEGDECRGVGYWRPGEEAPTILEPMGRNPQWITFGAASALFAWHDRTLNAKLPGR